MIQAYIYFFQPNMAIFMISDDNSPDTFFQLKDISNDIIDRLKVLYIYKHNADQQHHPINQCQFGLPAPSAQMHGVTLIHQTFHHQVVFIPH